MKWKQFIVRYYAFVPEDLVSLCDDHHAEIHMIYDHLIALDIQRTKRQLKDYSWQQADHLMSKLEAACELWLHVATKGMSSRQYDRRKRSAALLKRGQQLYDYVTENFLHSAKSSNSGD